MQIIPLSSEWHPETSTEICQKKLQNTSSWSLVGFVMNRNCYCLYYACFILRLVIQIVAIIVYHGSDQTLDQILLMAKILHQLRLAVYPIFYGVFLIHQQVVQIIFPSAWLGPATGTAVGGVLTIQGAWLLLSCHNERGKMAKRGMRVPGFTWREMYQKWTYSAIRDHKITVKTWCFRLNM